MDAAEQAPATRWWRWADRDQVSRVDAYTRQSLYLLLWGTPAFLVAQAIGRVPDAQRGVAAAVVAGGVLVTAAATVVLRDVMAAYPRTSPVPHSVYGFLGLAAVAYAALLGLPTETRGMAVMILWAAVTWSLGGLRGRRTTAALLAVLALGPGIAAREPLIGVLALGIGAFFLFTIRVSLWLLEVVRELDGARHARAALAVAEERLRFSRDVHDVLGRRLSVIGVQAELAATLAARGEAEPAAERMLEVRATAHQALREARELARGYRAPDLAQELEGARALLRSAGAEVDLDVDRLPRAWHEPAAWVVREAVTNVLRHSAARRVEVGYADGELRVVNDRPAPGPPGHDGSGIADLADRLAPLGAALRTEHEEDRFAVVVSLPGTGPAETAGAAR